MSGSNRTGEALSHGRYLQFLDILGFTDLVQQRAADKHMGRPPKLTATQQTEARRREEGATLAELARSYGVGKSTISRIAALARVPQRALEGLK